MRGEGAGGGRVDSPAGFTESLLWQYRLMSTDLPANIIATKNKKKKIKRNESPSLVNQTPPIVISMLIL